MGIEWVVIVIASLHNHFDSIYVFEQFPCYANDLTFQIASATRQTPCVELSDGNLMPIVALGTGRGTAKEVNVPS